MGRLIFNSEMGVVGVRGTIAHPVLFHMKGDETGKLQRYGGAYSRKDLRGTSNVLCKHPAYNPNRPLSVDQVATRAKFRNVIEEVKRVYADATLMENYGELFAAQKKYITLRGFIFSRVWATIS